jgi:hypothetical protein
VVWVLEQNKLSEKIWSSKTVIALYFDGNCTKTWVAISIWNFTYYRTVWSCWVNNGLSYASVVNEWK